MTNLMGGAPLPVTTGGSGPTEQRAAVPVYVVSGGQAPIGQRARRVVVVTSGQVEGGAAMPVYDAGATALYSNEAALPVYVVSGSLGIDPALVYTNKVKALNPIAYWPLAESSGTTITDESGNGRNGTYSNTAGVLTGITLGQTGIGDGRTAASFNGTTGYGNVFSTSFRDAFSGPEGTAAIWGKVSGSGIWTNGVEGRLLTLRVDNGNSVLLRKYTSNNTLRMFYIAGGTGETVDIPTSTIGWFHVAVTWSKAADQFKAYFNGAQSGATQTGIGTWVGSLSSTGTNIGAALTTPTDVFSGVLAHAAVWNTPLSAAQIATLAVVP